MKVKWTDENIKYFSKPIPKTESVSYLGWIIGMVVVIAAIIIFVF